MSPTISHKIAISIAVIIPFAGFIAAIVFAWGTGVDLASLFLFFGFAFATTLGVTVGYHRLFTHRSFKTYPAVKCIFAILGSMAIEGRVKAWVADHRRHHQYSDTEDDPHSPVGGRKKGFAGFLVGFWHSHIGWLFTRYDAAVRAKYIPDLLKDRVVSFVDKYFPLWVVLSLALPTLLGFLFIGGWRGAGLGLLWGGAVRVFLVHHMTWSINSICHLFGSKPFKSEDEARNNFVMALVSLGEGFHHNHHVFPTSARHGLYWWQIDVSWYVIRLLELCRLAWDVYCPDRASLDAKRA